MRIQRNPYRTCGVEAEIHAGQGGDDRTLLTFCQVRKSGQRVNERAPANAALLIGKLVSQQRAELTVVAPLANAIEYRGQIGLSYVVGFPKSGLGRLGEHA